MLQAARVELGTLSGFVWGEVPLGETLTLLDVSEPNDDQAKLVAGGMEILVGVLGNVLSGLGEEKH
jgi:hypothetical protein